MNATERNTPRPEIRSTRKQIRWTARWRAILWREWLLNGGFFLTFAALWLLLLWVIPVIDHPLPLLIIIVNAGIFTAIRLGGSDSGDGSESFAFSLPLTRSDYFWSRFLFGFLWLFVPFAIGILSIEHNLPARFWGLWTESGYAAANLSSIQLDMPISHYLFAALAPYTTIFVFASLATSRSALAFSWIKGLILAFAPAYLFTFVAFQIVDKSTLNDHFQRGFVLSGITVVLGSLFWGWAVYRQKTPALLPAQPRNSGGWALIFLLLFFLFLIFLFTSFFGYHFVSRP